MKLSNVELTNTVKIKMQYQKTIEYAESEITNKMADLMMFNNEAAAKGKKDDNVRKRRTNEKQQSEKEDVKQESRLKKFKRSAEENA